MAQDGSLNRSRSSSSDNSSHSEFLPVLSSLPYQALREAFYKDGFHDGEDSPWPIASLDRGSSRGYALLMPPAADTLGGLSPEDKAAFVDMARRQAREMSDLDADALDALAALWLRTADATGGASATVDELLAMRGVAGKQKANGELRGYRPDQRLEMMRALARLQSIWLNMAEVEIYEVPEGRKRPQAVKRSLQSRPFIITDRLGRQLPDGSFRIDRFRFRPGDVFAAFLSGPGRQTALLSAKALKYDPYRQFIEKRLTRYLSWQWRAKAAMGGLAASYKVRTLFEAVGMELETRWAARQRERLEKALDTLEADGVIAEWQYERWHQASATGRGWANEWFGTTVVIAPPQQIEEQYFCLDKPRHWDRQGKASEGSSSSQPAALGERLRLKRKQKGLSQLQLSEHLGINRAHLSKVEKGLVPSESLRSRIEKWLG